MIYSRAVTGQTATVQIVNDLGAGVEGLLAATFPTVYYIVAGPNARVQITLYDLALITTPWAVSSGNYGVKEYGGGYYRLDLPNAIFTAEVKVRQVGEASGKHLLADTLEVSSIFSIIEADDYIDTEVTPWALVKILKGTGAVGVGTELLRKRLFNTAAENLTSTNTVVGQAKQ